MISLTSTFVDDLFGLEQADVKRVLAALRQLQRNPRHPGLQTKKMEGCDFYEVRASRELRIIADLFSGDPVCCLADHHDAALKRALQIGRPVQERAVRDARRFEVQADESTDLLTHLTDAELRTAYGVPDAWIGALRSAPTSDAILNSGIDEVIGVEATLRLAAESSADPKERREVSIVRGDLILHCISGFAAADVVDEVILVSPLLTGLASSREFAGLTDLLRARRTRTIVITRGSEAPDHVRVVDALARIPTAEVLINDAVGVQIVACLAPTPWGFAGVGSGAGSGDALTSVGVFVPSRVGEDRAIRQVASIALEVRTSLDTERYSRVSL